MARPGTPTPYTIAVEADAPHEVLDHLGGLHHVNLMIHTPFGYWDDHGCTPTETFHSLRWAAGVISRTALHVGSKIAEQADTHGCAGWRGDRYNEPGCGIHASFNIGADVAQDTPAVFLRVPVEQADRWIAEIKDYLRRVIEADQQPVEPPETEPHPWHAHVTPGDTPTPTHHGGANT